MLAFETVLERVPLPLGMRGRGRGPKCFTGLELSMGTVVGTAAIELGTRVEVG
jgi:hypothetical protein